MCVYVFLCVGGGGWAGGGGSDLNTHTLILFLFLTGKDPKNPHGDYQIDRPESVIYQVCFFPPFFSGIYFFIFT